MRLRSTWVDTTDGLWLQLKWYPEHVIRSDHLLSVTSFAGASFWSDQHAATSESFLAVRHHESQFPVRKVCFCKLAVHTRADANAPQVELLGVLMEARSSLI
jgi:hypothetical protein